MYVFVAGASGFLGSQLTRRLLADGHKVRGGCRSRSLRQTHPNLDTFVGDLRNPETCAQAVEGVDAVILAAADTAGAAVMATTPLVQVTPNILINAQLLEAAHRAGCQRFLFLSSSTVYEPKDRTKIDESALLLGQPHPVYHAVGWMKRYSEILCQTYAQHIKTPMRCIVVRPSNVYGPGDKFDPGRSHVTAATLKKVADRMTPLEVWGDGSDLRDIIFIDDFIEGAMRAFLRDEMYYAVNICSGRLVTVTDILNHAIEADGFGDANVQYDPSKPRMASVLAMDETKAREQLGFVASTDLEVGFAKTFAWYRRSNQGTNLSVELLD